jgi:16S rRNA (guanine966-N2)-methyltransferase
MRIVGGRHRGRRLNAPRGRDLRPTADRVREAVFNILSHGIDGGDPEDASVLDAFAGVGGLGLEALSRGAAHVTFIDENAGALDCIRESAASFGDSSRVTLLKFDATRPPPPPVTAMTPCTLAFFDAPYGSNLTPAALLALAERGWIAVGAVCVIEVAAREAFQAPAGFAVLDQRTYGAARVVFLRSEA